VKQLRVAQRPEVRAVEVAGPGFINFRLADSYYHGILRHVVAEGENGFGRSELLTGQRINVEFVSANPTGPLHAGGGRWAAFGDALSRLLEWCGAEAHREYYLNDRGTQMALFGESLQAHREGRPLPEDGYVGEYMKVWAAEMPEDSDAVEWGYERVKRDIAEVLEMMNVRFDTWFSERSLVGSGAVDTTLKDLQARGVVYEADGATWLASTRFGDDKDRVLVRSDGEATYLLPDVAYHRDKFVRGFDLLIDVLGADHQGYVARLRAAVGALGHRPEELEVIIGQLVSLRRDGQAVRLSKRSGDIVELRDLLEAVGPDVARFVFLLQSLETSQTIDLDVVTAQSSENPVYYLQYAYARIAALGREAERRGIVRRPLESVSLDALTHERELEILRSLAEFPSIIEDACTSRAPYKVTTWVRDFARRFHGFYHECPILRSDVEPTTAQARLWLVESARIGLAVALALLGVSAPTHL
jgi:arginyl-tRNA synthetase